MVSIEGTIALGNKICLAFSMAEQFTGLLSGLSTRAITDMTDSFNQFADSLKSAAEVNPA